MPGLVKYNRNEDGTYGPTTASQGVTAKLYRPKADHGRRAKKSEHKTRWVIEEGEEFHVFRISAEVDYMCNDNNCMFSLVDDGDIILGENGEVIAKFPNVQNPNDAWHGYAVNSKQKQNVPSDELLDKMVEDKFISEATRQRIEKKKI